MADAGAPLPLAGGDTHGVEKPFRFFDLPQELRDWCYDYLTGSSVILKTVREVNEDEYEDYFRVTESEDAAPEATYSLPDENAIKIEIGAPPIINVFCVSRQMKSEYEQRVSKKTALVFSDHDDNKEFDEFDPDRVKIPHFEWATRAEYFGVVRVVTCDEDNVGDCATDALRAMKWIKATAGKLNNLSEMHVYLAVQCEPEDGDGKWAKFSHASNLQDALQKITEHGFVTRLRVFHGEKSVTKMEEVPAQDKLYVSWTKKDGWAAPKSIEKQSCGQVDHLGLTTV
jgi:hypothetical protein